MSGRPLRIEICGVPFTVDWVHREGSRLTEDDAGYWNLGCTSVSEQKISVRAVGQGPHQERDTVLHEILHAIVRMTSQSDRFKGADEKNPEEEVVYAMAGALLAVLRKNRHLVDYLTEEQI